MDAADKKKLIDEITRQFADKGMLLEAGWAIMRHLKLPEGTPQSQVKTARLYYMAGAQHLFASILGMLDAGAEPTAADERKMELIYEELKKVRAELEAWDVA